MEREAVQQALDKLESMGLTKRRRVSDSASGPVMRMDGREVLAFSGNDYLGLANHPKVVEAFIDAARKFGVAPAASPMMCGNTSAHEELEEACAEFTGRDRAIVFSTGYQANLGAITTLYGKGDVIYADKLCHASLIDAAQLSGAKLVRFHHLDTGNLKKRLADGDEARSRIILTESIFSMEGDKPKVPELVEVAKKNDALLYLDEAHGIGILGPTGRGLTEEYGLTQDDVPLIMGAFGKAVGSFGAFVAGPKDLIEYILQHARPHTFSTASPAALAAAALASMKLMQEEPERRARLFQRVRYFRAQAAAYRIPLYDSETPVQPVMVGPTDTCIAVSKLLWERGIHVPGVRPPTVQPGQARMRASITAAHEESHIDRFIEVLDEAHRNIPGWTFEAAA